MSGGEDVVPPLDPERTKVRINLSTAVLLSLVGVLATASITMGIYKNRMDNVEATGNKNSDAIVAQAEQMAELRTQLAVLSTEQKESRRLLERIDNKLDARP